MFVGKKKSEIRFDKTMPRVYFNAIETELSLRGLFGVDKNIYQHLGVIFLGIGFNPEDSVILSNYNTEDMSFDCVLNDEEFYHMRFSKDLMSIVISNNNYIYEYECIPLSYSELSKRVSLLNWSLMYSDGMIFSRYLSMDNIKFVIEIDSYCLEIILDKPKDLQLRLFDDNGCHNKYRLDNEEELMNYLISLKDSNKSIVDIYKDLILYLGDVSIYPEFILRIKDKYNNKITNLIHLRDGNLEEFGITNDSARVFLDKNDNWCVELSANEICPFNFCMSYRDGKETYCFSPINNSIRLRDYTNIGIGRDIDTAYDELNEVNIKVRKLFKKDSK